MFRALPPLVKLVSALDLSLVATCDIASWCTSFDAQVSASSVYFQSMPYRLGEDGTVDFDALAKSASIFMPKVWFAVRLGWATLYFAFSCTGWLASRTHELPTTTSTSC